MDGLTSEDEILSRATHSTTSMNVNNVAIPASEPSNDTPSKTPPRTPSSTSSKTSSKSTSESTTSFVETTPLIHEVLPSNLTNTHSQIQPTKPPLIFTTPFSNTKNENKQKLYKI